jgi:hypothetical protein
MGVTEKDKDTGLPLVGGGKQIPIDPALLPELRDKVSRAENVELKAGVYALNVLKALAIGATIGAEYAQAERDADQFILKLLTLHNLKREQIDPERPFDFEKGMINVR